MDGVRRFDGRKEDEYDSRRRSRSRSPRRRRERDDYQAGEPAACRRLQYVGTTTLTVSRHQARVAGETAGVVAGSEAGGAAATEDGKGMQRF